MARLPPNRPPNRPSGRLIPPGGLLAGITRLALFNPTGFAVVSNTPHGFLSSLAPLVAILVVFSGAAMTQLGWHVGLANFGQALCVLLAQPVAAQALAKWWKCDANWLRYATAMNWCQFAIPVVALIAVLAAQLFGSVIASQQVLTYATFGAIVAYVLVQHWFLARFGLGLSALKAAGFVVCVNIAIGLVLAVPELLRIGMGGATVGLQT